MDAKLREKMEKAVEDYMDQFAIGDTPDSEGIVKAILDSGVIEDIEDAAYFRGVDRGTDDTIEYFGEYGG